MLGALSLLGLLLLLLLQELHLGVLSGSRGRHHLRDLLGGGLGLLLLLLLLLLPELLQLLALVLNLLLALWLRRIGLDSIDLLLLCGNEVPLLSDGRGIQTSHGRVAEELLASLGLSGGQLLLKNGRLAGLNLSLSYLCDALIKTNQAILGLDIL